MPDTDPPLPRMPDDPDHLRLLRHEAQRRLNEESQPPPRAERISHLTVYGGPPPEFNGEPVTRRWTLRTLLLLIAAFIAGIIGLFFAARKVNVPVYGGPPPPHPHKFPDEGPKPVYGGPPPQSPGKP